MNSGFTSLARISRCTESKHLQCDDTLRNLCATAPVSRAGRRGSSRLCGVGQLTLHSSPAFFRGRGLKNTIL